MLFAKRRNQKAIDLVKELMEFVIDLNDIHNSNSKFTGPSACSSFLRKLMRTKRAMATAINDSSDRFSIAGLFEEFGVYEPKVSHNDVLSHAKGEVDNQDIEFWKATAKDLAYDLYTLKESVFDFGCYQDDR